MKLEKMGMRTIKTGLAVMFCVLVGTNIVENVLYAAIACIISMQNTVKGSLKSGLARIKGTIVGGIVGFIFILINPGNPFVCGIGIMIVIYTCNVLKLNNSVVVSSMTFLSIHLGVVGDNVALYSISRVMDTSVGVVIGVLINYFIIRPNYLETTMSEFKRVEKIVSNLLEQKIIKKEEINIDKLEKEIQKLENIYSKFLDELDYSRNDMDINDLEKAISICREIHFHMQSIELLSKKLYLNEKNYDRLREFYNIEKINWEVNEQKSPVFNYHLGKIISQIKELKTLNDYN
ncbi:MAG: aromatic acid exporter family protein [Romboutsia sp.]